MGISPMKEAMLRALVRYKYLTVSHVLALGISISRSKVRQYFTELNNDRGFTGRLIHQGMSENAKKKGLIVRGRHEYLYYLTAKGAKFLASHTELCLPDIRYPKRPKQYLLNDYFHRVSTISLHISFDKWIEQMGYEESQFLVYYHQQAQRKQQRFESETCIWLKEGRHFTPDAIC